VKHSPSTCARDAKIFKTLILAECAKKSTSLSFLVPRGQQGEAQTQSQQRCSKAGSNLALHFPVLYGAAGAHILPPLNPYKKLAATEKETSICQINHLQKNTKQTQLDVVSCEALIKSQFSSRNLSYFKSMYKFLLKKNVF
jgi:hypothetical protein